MNKLWENDLLQFARLISEIEAAGGFNNSLLKTLCQEMDLNLNDLGSLVDRAQAVWEDCKNQNK